MNPTADGNSKQSQPAPLPIDPLTEQIESQIETLEETIETESVADEDGEVQQRVQHLIGLIKASLQSRTLDPKTQRELARLLSLAPRLKGRHVQQLNLLDLAVSILLEPGSLNPNAAEWATGAIANNQIANNQIANNQIALNKTAAKNLVFVQETRRQIAQQSRTYPDLLRAIFVTGEGTPYIRLISGLSWFFLVFVVAPLTVAGLTFAVRDIAGISTTRADLTKARTELTKQKNRNNELNLRQNALEAQLGRTRRWLANLEETADTAAADEASSDVTVTVDQQDLLNIRAGIDNAISNLDEADESEDESEVSNQENEDNTGQPENESTSSSPENNSFSLILLAVAMGALGSTISVIVRANTFIRQTE
ncbi:MAG: hypothetical protein WA901_02020, partial [Phormidesmis sp.]